MQGHVVVFGAGQIGRGFIGDICSASGYSLVFVDVAENVVKLLNEKKEYPLWLLSGDSKIERTVTNLSALDFSRKEEIAKAVAGTNLAFTAVGANNVPAVAPMLAEGIRMKAEESPDSHLNVVICENLLGSSKVLKGEIVKYLPVDHFPFLNEKVGFIETVVSRMVSPLSDELRRRHPLLVTVEPYNRLPVEKNKFKVEIPPVKGFYPVENLFPYEELKLFVHNLSHACLAYAGYMKGHTYIWESLEDAEIRKLLDGVLTEAKSALIKKHGFQAEEIDIYISDLIERFDNKSLGDTVYRVGRDPMRKIGSDDRLAGGIKLCVSQGINPENICFVMAYCLCYNYPNDAKAVEMQKIIKGKGVSYVLENISKISDERLTKKITEDYNGLNESGGLKGY